MYVLSFSDEQSAVHEQVGGKGANLGRLTREGFPVPPGFTVTTHGYRAFLDGDGLRDKIESIVAGFDYDDAEMLDRGTSDIRNLILQQEMPAEVTEAVLSAYRAMGDDVHVAVRSSGTAEDLADASFAGLHDTYLDILGTDAVLDAVRRCWASLWTARAASYRHTRGFASTDHAIAVVVQTMVPAEMSGVMFTANPLTTATDEIVINSSWALGEAIVAGIATPDEYVVDANRLRVRDRTVGAKEVRVVRNPETGVGTVTEDVPAEERERLTLTDDAAVELADLGRRVQRHYGDFPQDIEWAFANGQFYLLQSRPITGVTFTWDDDVDGWQWLPESADDTVWSRNWADEIWTGAITPLMYSFRARGFTWMYEYSYKVWGQPELSKYRSYKYYKGGVYFSSNQDKTWVENSSLPQLRPGLLANVPPAWASEILEAPFSILSYLRLHARCALIDKNHGLATFFRCIDHYIENEIANANGLPDDALRRLSDAELRRYTDERIRYEGQYCVDMGSGFMLHARDMLGLLGLMVAKWYDGGEVEFIDLITGAPRPTATLAENHELFELAKAIHESDYLSATFAAHVDGAFFSELEKTDEGRAWLAEYQVFMDKHGHRGHADRDIYFLRRIEDPSVDYRAIASMLNADFSINPAETERQVEARRVAAVEAVIENIRKKPLGALRVEAFKAVLGWSMRFLLARDDERHWVDRSTFTIKRCFKEINRRLRERGYFSSERDYFFLSAEELYSMLDGTANIPLTEAKIAGRMVAFDEIETRQRANPKYVQRNRDVDHIFEPHDESADAFRGMPTSRGTVEGVARVVSQLKDIGRVKKGEILITNSTDPGWTPVFMLISGIVLETGGMLAHGSCLAREYGFPAVQLPRATQIIPDGARISVDGITGEIQLLDDDGA